jgi:hypothetical protein
MYYALKNIFIIWIIIQLLLTEKIVIYGTATYYKHID